MHLSTKNSLSGRVADYFGLNKKFNQYQKIDIDPKDPALISPVEGKIVHIGDIDESGTLISKHNKKIQLGKLIGKHSDQFIGGKFINFPPIN